MNEVKTIRANLQSDAVGGGFYLSEICETITKSVEGPKLEGNCALPMEASCLLPEFNSDEDVEDILQQISDLLGSQLGDTSQCTDIEGVEDLSVDEILKQAEQIVRASTPYFERKVHKNCTGIEPLLEPIRKNVNQLAKRTSKLVSHRQPNLNESSQQDVNKNTRTDVSGSQLDVKNDIFDRNGNSPTPTNDSDDEIFESPIDSPGPETPRRNDSSNLRKSCSDSECRPKETLEVKKSSSAGTCDIGNLGGEHLRRTTELLEGSRGYGEKREHVKELTLSDLRVSPYFSSRETISEAISPEEPEANVINFIEEANVPNESINLAVSGITDHNVHQNNNGACATSMIENTSSKPREKNCTVTNELVTVGVPKEFDKLESAKNTGRVDQSKVTDRRTENKNYQSMATSKQLALQNAKLFKKSTKSIFNLNSHSKTAKADAEPACPNEEHCVAITALQSQIEALTNKITEHEKLEVRARKNETLAAAERQRTKILQDEVKSQEELIVGYQRENQRLTNDVLSAKNQEPGVT